MLTHSQRLENWLGAAQVAEVSRSFSDWYGPPVALSGVPGNVRVMGGGDFIGEYTGPRHSSAVNRAMDILREEKFRRFKRARFQRGAFSGLSALIAAKTGGKSCTMTFNKVGTAPTAIAGVIDLWGVANQPAAGAAGAAAAAGTAFTSASTGALGFANAVANANTSHFVNAQVQASVVNNALLLIDRLFGVAKTMSSSATEAVTGTFSRYQSQTSTDLNYIGGNFCYPRVSATLSATAHNWTVCQYTNQGGTASQSFPSIGGVSACATNQVDLTVGNWFLPLASGDTGVKALSQMQCSSASVTGTLDFIVAHPIAVMACPVANLMMNIDGVTSAFNLQQIYDNACLSVLELPKAAASACTYNGIVLTVSE